MTKFPALILPEAVWTEIESVACRVTNNSQTEVRIAEAKSPPTTVVGAEPLLPYQSKKFVPKDGSKLFGYAMKTNAELAITTEE